MTRSGLTHAQAAVQASEISFARYPGKDPR